MKQKSAETWRDGTIKILQAQGMPRLKNQAAVCQWRQSEIAGKLGPALAEDLPDFEKAGEWGNGKLLHRRMRRSTQQSFLRLTPRPQLLCQVRLAKSWRFLASLSNLADAEAYVVPRVTDLGYKQC